VALLDVRALSARYGELEAVHGVDLTVESGSIVALLGANGAGKTSTLRAITGAIAKSGDVRFDGVALNGVTPEKAARLGISHTPEGRGTLSRFTVWENLTLGGYAERDPKELRARRDRVLTYFPWLTERRDQMAGALSGGEQQMLAIARALMMKPRLLLLDEPSLGLGPLIVQQIFELLRTINREDGVSILVAEQNCAIALATASTAFVLETGRVVASGPSSELLQNDRIRRSYLGY
jgi:branched-chain amino acid transport system ATP-binding protein